MRWGNGPGGQGVEYPLFGQIIRLHPDGYAYLDEIASIMGVAIHIPVK